MGRKESRQEPGAKGAALLQQPNHLRMTAPVERTYFQKIIAASVLLSGTLKILLIPNCVFKTCVRKTTPLPSAGSV